MVACGPYSAPGHLHETMVNDAVGRLQVYRCNSIATCIYLSILLIASTMMCASEAPERKHKSPSIVVCGSIKWHSDFTCDALVASEARQTELHVLTHVGQTGSPTMRRIGSCMHIVLNAGALVILVDLITIVANALAPLKH